jgi:MOSC domain-containing protein YiiM
MAASGEEGRSRLARRNIVKVSVWSEPCVKLEQRNDVSGQEVGERMKRRRMTGNLARNFGNLDVLNME